MWRVYALLSALFAALTSILAKIGIEDVNSHLATALRTVVVLFMAWGMVLVTGTQDGITAISKKSWLFIILSGLATGASWLFYYRALQLGEASRAKRPASDPSAEPRVQRPPSEDAPSKDRLEFRQSPAQQFEKANPRIPPYKRETHKHALSPQRSCVFSAFPHFRQYPLRKAVQESAQNSFFPRAPYSC